jgi:hypothetical protein
MVKIPVKQRYYPELYKLRYDDQIGHRATMQKELIALLQEVYAHGYQKGRDDIRGSVSAATMRV